MGDVIEDEDGKAYRVVSRSGTTVELDEPYTGPANGKLKLGCGLQENIGLASRLEKCDSRYVANSRLLCSRNSSLRVVLIIITSFGPVT